MNHSHISDLWGKHRVNKAMHVGNGGGCYCKFLEIIFEIKPEPDKFPRLSKQDEKVKTAAPLS